MLRLGCSLKQMSAQQVGHWHVQSHLDLSMWIFHVNFTVWHRLLSLFHVWELQVYIWSLWKVWADLLKSSFHCLTFSGKAVVLRNRKLFFRLSICHSGLWPFRKTPRSNPLCLHPMVQACSSAWWPVGGGWMCAPRLWSARSWLSRCLWSYSPLFNCVPPSCGTRFQSQWRVLCQYFLTSTACVNDQSSKLWYAADALLKGFLHV